MFWPSFNEEASFFRPFYCWSFYHEKRCMNNSILANGPSTSYQVTRNTQTITDGAPPSFQRAVVRLASIFSNLDRFLFCKCISQPQTDCSTERRAETVHASGCFSFLRRGHFDCAQFPASLNQGLVYFSSLEGKKRLERSKAKFDFHMLANQFEPQFANVLCGAASGAIVLNALFDSGSSLPRDLSRLHPNELKYNSDDKDFTIPRFTQEILLNSGHKTRAQVFGQPVLINNKEVSDFGYQLHQLSDVLQKHKAKTNVTVVDDQLNDQEVRQRLISILKQTDHYVIVSYLRDAVGQSGGGHFSPLGAYDKKSDSFLVMDVNPSSREWVWMPSAALIRGMRTFDSATNRGFIEVSKGVHAAEHAGMSIDTDASVHGSALSPMLS